MDEYFFVLSGQGTYIIGDEKVRLLKGDFIKIPAGVSHRVNCDSKEGLEMIYFGINCG